MRKGLTLIEVLVAIVLIVSVIGTMLQMKNNNLSFLEKFSTKSNENSYISLATSPLGEKLENKKIFLEDGVNFNDDEIRKKLKGIKINLEQSDDEKIELPENDFIQTATIINSQYSLVDNNHTKVFYHFKLDYK